MCRVNTEHTAKYIYDLGVYYIMIRYPRVDWMKKGDEWVWIRKPNMTGGSALIIIKEKDEIYGATFVINGRSKRKVRWIVQANADRHHDRYVKTRRILQGYLDRCDLMPVYQYNNFNSELKEMKLIESQHALEYIRLNKFRNYALKPFTPDYYIYDDGIYIIIMNGYNDPLIYRSDIYD